MSGRFDAEVVDEHSVFFQELLVTETILLKQVPVWGISGSNHPDLVVVEGINHGDEPPGLGLTLQIHDRNVLDKHGMEDIGHPEIIVGP